MGTHSLDLGRIPSSGMLRSLALVRTDVSEERIAFITRIGELGTTLAIISNRSKLRRHAIQLRHGILHSHRCEELKSYINLGD
jgi:hypothetical protein